MLKNALKIYLLSIAFLISYWANADGDFGQIQAIEKLAQASASTKAQCDSFIQNIESLDHSTRDYFSSKDITLQILKRAKDYPGTPSSTENVLSSLLYLDSSDLPGGTVAGDLRTAIARLNDCRSVDFYAILNRLLASRKRYHFSQEEEGSLRAVVMKYLTQESSGPRYLFQVRMMIRLLAQSTKEMLLFPTPDQRTKIDTLERTLKQSEANEGKHLALLEADKAKVADKANTNELNVNRSALIQILWQLGESQKLRLTLVDILSQIAKSN
jgi:hypothetical protein